MRRNFTTELSTSAIKDFQKNLEEWTKKLDEANKNIVSDIAKYGSKRMKQIYNESGVQDNSPMTFDITGDDTEKKVSMTGEQAIYDEFGTGTFGAESPHPTKNAFDLNPYNSGKTIRRNKDPYSYASFAGIPEDGLYWTYTDARGKKKYTQGIAAQKEGYDSLKDSIEKAPSIIKKRMEDTLK